MRYAPIQEGFWWKVKIGDGNQKIGKCFSETESQRLAAALETAFEDGKYVGAASRDAEIAELKNLLVLIFESTHPYRDDGTCTFSDSVADKWKELMP